ncbi:MFS general substrate transporter [Meredithblackwellia eburnea MCA 4105]
MAQTTTTTTTTTTVPPAIPMGTVPVPAVDGHTAELAVAYDHDKQDDRQGDDGPGGGHEPFEEGGWRGWLNVFGAFLVLFATFGYANAFGAYQSWYQTHQYVTMSPSAIAWVGSVGVWLEFSSALFTGPIFDRGYFRHSLGAGSALFVFCLFMTSLQRSFWQAFLAQGVGMGISMGLTYVPAISVLSHYFVKKRSLVMGLAITGSSVGGICYPILLNSTFNKIGFPRGVQASGYLILGCLLLANLIMKPRPPKRRKRAGGGGGAKADDESLGTVKRPRVRDLLGEWRYSVAVAACFFATLGNFFPLYFIQTFFEESGLGANLTFYSLAIMNAGSCFGRVFATYLADKVGTLNVMACCCAASGVLTFAMFGATSPVGAILCTILFGFFSGAVFSLMSPVFVALSTDVSEIGLRQGLAFPVSGLAALIGPPISGALLSAANGHFKWAITFAGGSLLVGSAGFFWSRNLTARVKGTRRV